MIIIIIIMNDDDYDGDTRGKKDIINSFWVISGWNELHSIRSNILLRLK